MSSVEMEPKTVKPKTLKALKHEAKELKIPKYSTMKKFELEVAINHRLEYIRQRDVHIKDFEWTHSKSQMTFDMPVDMLYEISKYLVGTDSFYKMAVLSRSINTRLQLGSLIPKHQECKVLHVFEILYNNNIQSSKYNKQKRLVAWGTHIQRVFIRDYLNSKVGSMVGCTYVKFSERCEAKTTYVKRIDLSYNIDWDESVKNIDCDLVNHRAKFIKLVYEEIPFLPKFIWTVLMNIDLLECLTHHEFPFIEFLFNHKYIERLRSEQSSKFSGTASSWYSERYPHLFLSKGLYYLPSNDRIQNLIDLPTRGNWEFFRLYDCPIFDERRQYLNKPPQLW